MADITKFDKEMFKKYKKDILEAIGKMDNLNLSKSISKLVGYSEKFDKVTLSGFFFWDIHDSSGKYTMFRAKACKSVNKLLNADKRLLSFMGDDWLGEYSRDKKKIRERDLSIGEHNMKDIFPPKSITCKKKKLEHNGNLCGNSWEINFENHAQFLKGKNSELYLPKIIFNNGDPLSSIWQEIVSHSVCNHDDKNGLNIGTIFLLGKNIGSEVECLYVFVMVVFPKNKWDICGEDSRLTKPAHSADFFYESGLLPYCDYFIIASLNSVYYAIPVKTTSKATFNWKELNTEQEFDTRFSKKIKISNNSARIIIKADDSDQNIELDYNGTSTLPIYHILVFDNHQDRRQEGGANEFT